MRPHGASIAELLTLCSGRPACVIAANFTAEPLSGALGFGNIGVGDVSERVVRSLDVLSGRGFHVYPHA